MFVTEIRPETNEVVLGSDKDVYTNRLYANQLNFMALPDIEEPGSPEGKDPVLACGKLLHRAAHRCG